jgi:predicted porin
MALGKKDQNIWVDYGARYNQEQWGWVAALSYQYRSIFLELKYLDSISKKTITRHFIKQTQSIEICLGYRFKVLDKITSGKQKTICPRF